MGRILKVTNFGNILTDREEVRLIEIKGVLVDTGMAMLGLYLNQINKFIRPEVLKVR